MDYGVSEEPIDYNSDIIKKFQITSNPAFQEEYARFGKNKCFLPKSFREHAEEIADFEVRQDDIWFASFMKTGTTWAKELIWLIVNDMNFSEARNTSSYIRFPNFENSATVKILRAKRPASYPTSMQVLERQTSRRLIHTHLPWSLLPKSIQSGACKPKIIYITRSPKDTVVSYFHHRVLYEGFLGTIDDFVDLFVNDAVRYAPFGAHVQEYWPRRHEPYILFLTYEQMKEDLLSVAKTVADFLGKQIDHSKTAELLDYLSLDKMKVNSAVNDEDIIARLRAEHGVQTQLGFIRKGELGSWKNELSDESKAKMDIWCNANQIKGLWD